MELSNTHARADSNNIKYNIINTHACVCGLLYFVINIILSLARTDSNNIII